MKKYLFAFAMFSALASTAMAEGVYVALDVGQSKAKDMCSAANFGVNPAVGISSCSDTATAYRIGGGYQFSRYFGAEVSYADLGNVNPVSGPGGFTQSTKAKTLQGAAIGYLPLPAGFSIFGKLGLARTKFDQSWNGPPPGNASASNTNLAYGIGAQFDFLRNFAVRAQYEDFGNVGTSPVTATTTGKSKVTLMSAGLVFRF